MRWSREDYIGLMTFENNDRQMFCELFGPLVGLEDEWRVQGASSAELDMTGFDWDYVPTVQLAAETGLFRGLEPLVLEDTAEYCITRDEYGRTAKLIKSSSTIPLPQTYPVTDMDSWLKIKPKFVFCEERLDRDQLEWAAGQQRQGALLVLPVPGGFDLPRQLMGEEELCYAYYDQPELISDIMETLTGTCTKVFERLHALGVTVDNLAIHEDMAGKSGPLIGPSLIEASVDPYYRTVIRLAAECGCRLFAQDSDGNMNAVLDSFVDTGLNVAFPAEPAADMDIVALRKKYGNRLAFKGGIDKHVLRKDKAAIRDELEYKLQPLMQQGGVAFGLDHRIPNGTPLENYRYYVETGRELLGLPPLDGTSRGWGRMAF